MTSLVGGCDGSDCDSGYTAGYHLSSGNSVEHVCSMLWMVCVVCVQCDRLKRFTMDGRWWTSSRE
jgi:hypothetical protein